MQGTASGGPSPADVGSDGSELAAAPRTEADVIPGIHRAGQASPARLENVCLPVRPADEVHRIDVGLFGQIRAAGCAEHASVVPVANIHRPTSPAGVERIDGDRLNHIDVILTATSDIFNDGGDGLGGDKTGHARSC